MRAISSALLAGVVLAGCYALDPPHRPALTSFRVQVVGVYASRGPDAQFGDPGTPLAVVSDCAKRHGGQALVPPGERGTRACPYAIPIGSVDFDVEVIALGRDGAPLTTFNGPVSFRPVPGDLTGGYDMRWTTVVDGVGRGVVRVAHLYSEVRVWAEDGPPRAIYADGGVLNPDQLPLEPAERTFATGASPIIHFENPTIAKIQMMDVFDNRTSPFVGQFITLGSPPESGETLKQTCPADPENDGREALLVVTGTDPTGFFVTDITACRQPEILSDALGNTVRTPEPNGMMPGTFGSMFIYNYSFPEGLDQGDLLWSVAGAVQEFTSTTQLTFPSWTIAEKVRALPESEWDKWLSKVPIVDVNLRHCGLDNDPDEFVTDLLCGHNRRNMKMESLESSLVRVRNVKFPDVFTNCDRDGDGEVPFFCETRDGQGNWYFGECTDFETGESSLTPLQKEEAACNIACVTGEGPWAGKVCSEIATFTTFGQFLAEMAGPGPAEANLDDSLPARIESHALGATPVRSGWSFRIGESVRILCTADARVKAGDELVEATPADTLVPAGRLFEHVFGPGETHISLLADGAASGTCQVARNTRTRINIVTRDAVPELEPNCNPNDGDPEKAQQCRNFRGARYDVVGHLRHLQPGRPRWVVLPRDKDDICCYPGEGLACPAPIQPCP